ncbi:RMD1 family protein [Rickettsiales endosymbiont of Stachyamoeba lipophora]|uniref:RMD1 family protein n=1 Tax=Rickettsiales endosymbiont of Stachyamoeba lipophora TaxID=2486578 RepID=UPI000F652B98|nr:RMD1 family protein [Rickettsiales endosymbiont of Stachyamoeba lipophora]AZL14979.1 RMD1 family protein [Rickettsiales endosymbiont of Stachyamoeba lipophora]
MKSSAYAIAEGFKTNELAEYLRGKGFEPKRYDDVIHISTQNIDTKDSIGDIFFFNYGCIVTWNVVREFSHSLIKDLAPFSHNHFEENYFIEQTNFMINREEKTQIVEEEDLIVLEEEDELIKLSMSHALSQSAKLDAFELRVNKVIANTKPIADELAKTGKVSLSRKKLSKKIGWIFTERNSINLDNDILDTPEFFWRRPRYEPLYTMAALYLDINTRVDILNRKLKAIYELYEILSNELNHIHSSRLEWIVIILIALEVVMVILKDLLKLI